MLLSESQFNALVIWIRHEAYVAAGATTHQARAQDNYPEINARYELTGIMTDDNNEE